mgnify:CR=1 FL=1
MRLFIFAIGGTGARVIRSLTMMLASGINGLDSSTEIIPIIIDYDLSNGDKTRAINALRSYASIHNILYPDTQNGNLYNNHFFMTKVLPLSQAGIANPQNIAKDYEFNFGPQGFSIKFSNYLRMASMTTNPEIQLTEDLLKSLYDCSPEDTKDAELELDMAKGFKGNPNIGSVVFHGIRHTDEFTAFKNTFNSATDRVFIISSIFGGTGASGFPEIVNAIRTSGIATLNSAIIGSAIVLPYFDLQKYNPANGDTGAIDADSFNAKTRAALSFYASQNGLNTRVNAIYYIGDKNHDAYQYNEGESRQQNDAHVVEFVAASSVIDFMKRTGFVNDEKIIVPNPVSNTDHQAFEFEIKDERIGESIKLPDFEQSTQALFLDDLSTFAFAMKYYRDVVCGDRNRIGTTGYNASNRFNLTPKLGRGFYHLLDEFLLNNGKWGFYNWLDELKSHTHKLYPYVMDKSEPMKKVFSHKEISVKVGNNPVRDDVLTGELNKASRDFSIYNEQTFLKLLKDVFSNKYKSVR